MKKTTASKLINPIPHFNFTDIKILGSGYEKTFSSKKPVNTKERDYYTLHCIISGSGFVEVNNQKYLLGKKQLFLSYPKMNMVYYPTRKSPWKYAWINFSGSKTVELLNLIGFSNKNPILTTANDEILNIFFDNAIACDKEPSLSHFISLGNFYNIITNLLREKDANNNEDDDNNNLTLIDLALDYINKNYMNPYLNQSMVASYLGISTQYFSKLIKKHTNSGYASLLMQTRIQKSFTFLAETTMPIQEVAFAVGFNDPYYFSNVFKKFAKCSPSEYRQQHHT